MLIKNVFNNHSPIYYVYKWYSAKRAPQNIFIKRTNTGFRWSVCIYYITIIILFFHIKKQQCHRTGTSLVGGDPDGHRSSGRGRSGLNGHLGRNSHLGGYHHHIPGHHPSTVAARTSPGQGIGVIKDSAGMIALALQVDINIGHISSTSVFFLLEVFSVTGFSSGVSPFIYFVYVHCVSVDKDILLIRLSVHWLINFGPLLLSWFILTRAGCMLILRLTH